MSLEFYKWILIEGTLVENLKRVRPTRFLGVPRVWEKIAEKMQEIGQSNKGIIKFKFPTFISTALCHQQSKNGGKI